MHQVKRDNLMFYASFLMNRKMTLSCIKLNVISDDMMISFI